MAAVFPEPCIGEAECLQARRSGAQSWALGLPCGPSQGQQVLLEGLQREVALQCSQSGQSVAPRAAGLSDPCHLHVGNGAFPEPQNPGWGRGGCPREVRVCLQTRPPDAEWWGGPRLRAGFYGTATCQLVLEVHREGRASLGWCRGDGQGLSDQREARVSSGR